MRKLKKIMAAMLLPALLLGLAACDSKQEREAFLPESHNDKLFAVLPENLPADWQWFENWQEAEDVPRLLLLQNDEVIEPGSFGRSWSYAEPGTDMVNSYIACGAHPIEAQSDLPQLTDEGAPTVQLVWQAEPTEVCVTAYAYDEWQQRKCGNTLPDEILHTEVPVAADGTFTLLADEHNYVYVINAKWQAQQAELSLLGGDGEWAFYAE